MRFGGVCDALVRARGVSYVQNNVTGPVYSMWVQKLNVRPSQRYQAYQWAESEKKICFKASTDSLWDYLSRS